MALLASSRDSIVSVQRTSSWPTRSVAGTFPGEDFTMLRLAFTTVITFGALSLGLAAEADAQNRKPPAPCGPKAELSAEFQTNVAEDSRCFEIRMYTVDKEKVGTGEYVGDIDMLHQRFREEEVAIFEKHGAEIVGVFQSLDNSDTLVWMLAYKNRAHRQEVWRKFLDDPAWKALLSRSTAFRLLRKSS